MDTAAENTELRSGAELFWGVLVDEGVDTVFGYPGGAILPVYDAMCRFPIHHVLTRHEQGAAHMADGYARASGRVGVAIATSGPGATNLVTGLATAMMDSVPIVCVTGQVPSGAIGTDAFQETDVIGVVTPITKHAILVTRAEDVAPAMREAMAIARSGRPGPVLVDITKDAQLGRISPNDPGPFDITPRTRREWAVSDADLDRAAALIDAAERPIILTGRGVILSGASERLAELVATSDIPVASTLLGLGGFAASDRHHLGMMGLHGDAWVNQAVQSADLILAVGMRFDDRVTGDLSTFARNAKKIHIELDPAEVGKVVPVDVGLIGDAHDILGRLLPRLSTRTLPEWNDRLEQTKCTESRRCVLQQPADGLLRGQHAMRALWEKTGGNATIVTDVGQHQMWEAQYHPHDRPRSLITSGGLGTMGFALPAAMGAKMACPDDEVWVVVGDGGFQMTCAELSTIKQEGIKLRIALINNACLGMVRQLQELYCDRNYEAVALHNPDFCALAAAHGVQARAIDHIDQLDEAIDWARNAPDTVVLEFQVVPEDNVYPAVRLGGDGIDDMIRRPQESGSLEAGGMA